MSKVATEFSFTHKELMSMMLKEADIHEGLWSFSVNFRLGAGAFGPTEAEVAPTGFVGVDSLGIRRAPQTGPLVFDAADLNPKLSGV